MDDTPQDSVLDSLETEPVGQAAPQPQLQAQSQTPSQAVASTGAPSWLEQDPVLRDLWAQQLQPLEIAEKLGRSVAAIMTRAARLGLPRRFAPGRKAGQKYARPRPTTQAGTGAHQVRHRAVADDDYKVEVVYTERVCLMCLKKFESEGRHNRICPSCKGGSEYAAGSRIPDINFGAGS